MVFDLDEFQDYLFGIEFAVNHPEWYVNILGRNENVGESAGSALAFGKLLFDSATGPGCDDADFSVCKGYDVADSVG